METVEAHSHSFPLESWPFVEPVNTAAYTSSHVLSGSPILLVFHDHDGEWQFLADQDGEECKIICLGCAYERDSSIAALAGIPVGWIAFRDSVDEPWQSESYPDSESAEG